MNFEVLKRSHVKRNILIGMVVVLVLSAVILTFTRAKYKIIESIPLVNGTINYDLSDLNLIGVYIQEGEEYIQTNEIPTSGYEFNSEESYCTINNERDDTITLSFDMTTQNLTVTPLTKKGTKCYLYFDEKLSAGDTILAASKPQGQTTDWTGQTTYYYTGKPDNWVYFAGFYWRIIRINGDGSIRMIYQGTSANETGTGTQIGTSAFNSSSYGSYYVGFKYTSNDPHGTEMNSTILGEAANSSSLNTWYNNNLTSYTNYIDGNAGFCGDRTSYSGSGSITTYYGAHSRLVGNNNPSLQCSDSKDIYTTTDSSMGNKSLTYPIGLLTADEYVLSGGINSYLNVGITCWTMSPSYFGFENNAYVFFVLSSGYLDSLYGLVSNANGVRPVINLRSDVVLLGSGTTTDPFRLVL